jgi:hypothetical protein
VNKCIRGFRVIRVNWVIREIKVFGVTRDISVRNITGIIKVMGLLPAFSSALTFKMPNMHKKQNKK